MTFTHLLHDLVGLNGCRVAVSASSIDGHPVLTSLGVIEVEPQ